MLQVKLPVVDRIHAQSNKFVMGVQNKATVESKLDDSPGLHVSIWTTFPVYKVCALSRNKK